MLDKGVVAHLYLHWALDVTTSGRWIIKSEESRAAIRQPGLGERSKEEFDVIGFPGPC
jgi:hypothetical protein